MKAFIKAYTLQIAISGVLILIAYLYGISLNLEHRLQTEKAYIVPTKAIRQEPSSTPYPTTKVDVFDVNSRTEPAPTPLTRVVTCDEPSCPQECRGQTMTVESSYKTQYACCQVYGTYKLMKVEDCRIMRSQSKRSNSDNKVLVTIPHNGKQIRCIEGYDTKVYNFSLTLKKDLDEFSDLVNEGSETYDIMYQGYLDLMREADNVFYEYANQFCE